MVPGGFEGWSFSLNKTASTNPPPGVTPNNPAVNPSNPTVSLSVDEGICGWVARNDEPVFLRENSLSDPRMKVVPELEEERFQSMVAVPLNVADRRSGSSTSV